MQMLGVDSHRSSFHSFFRFFDEIFVKNDDVLSFVILDEIHVLQRRDDVFFLDRRHFANFIDRYRRSINRLESQKLSLVDGGLYKVQTFTSNRVNYRRKLNARS